MRPPSTKMFCPVMNPACWLHRNAASPPNSSGVPKRPAKLGASDFHVSSPSRLVHLVTARLFDFNSMFIFDTKPTYYRHVFFV
jgi:hypothetical protein